MLSQTQQFPAHNFNIGKAKIKGDRLIAYQFLFNNNINYILMIKYILDIMQ